MVRRNSVARTLDSALVVLLIAACSTGAQSRADQDTSDSASTVREALLTPGSDTMNLTAPDTFRVKLETSKGDFVIEVQRDWAPNGADRFYNLVRNGFYDEARFFRVVSGFMVQFGIPGDPQLSAVWQSKTIPDDPVTQSNKRGFITYAMRGPNTRTTQVFISYGDNSFLDAQGFSAFGQVIQGMDVVDNLYSGYGEGPPRGRGPNQGRIQGEGNAYLEREFPKLDYVKQATIIEQ